MNNIILFDIDRTLYDSDKASSGHNRNVLTVLGTTDEEKVKKAKEEYKSMLANEREYDPKDYLKLLSKRFNFPNPQQLLNVYYGKDFTFIYKDAVFPEVTGVLEKLKQKYRLGIYSEGADRFQNHKFNSLGLGNYFEKDLVFIQKAKDTPEAIVKIPDGAVIVDDKESICRFLTDNKIRTIWLNRKDDRKSDDFETIHNLSELPEILL
jgi:FMN phosphatase YigB (HAD superfamily)